MNDLDFTFGFGSDPTPDPAIVAARKANKARARTAARDGYQAAMNDTLDPVAARDAARRAARIAQRGEG